MMMINETYVNTTQGGIIGESGPYEPFTDDIGILFLDLQKEHGRCRSKVYIDTDKGSKAIGWAFEKRVKYQDSPETYLQVTWVTLYEREPETTHKVFYKYI